MHRSRLGLGLVMACTLASAGCSSTAVPVVADGGPVDSGTDSGGLGFTPSNIDLSGMDLSKVGDFVVAETNCTIASGELLASCGNGADVLAYKLATQSDGSKVGVYVARSIRIEAAAQLTVQGNYPVVLVALDQISILASTPRPERRRSLQPSSRRRCRRPARRRARCTEIRQPPCPSSRTSITGGFASVWKTTQ